LVRISEITHAHALFLSRFSRSHSHASSLTC
jgi:hypothetical protein